MRADGERGRSWPLLLPVVLLPIIIVQATVPSVVFRPGADEGWFLTYATRVAEQGPAAFPELFREYLRDAEARKWFPSPLRITSIAVDALAVRLGGPRYESLQKVSLAAFLALVVLVYVEVRRRLGAPTALWTALLLAVSPLHLAMARRALADSLIATLVVVSLGLCIHGLVTRERAHAWWWGVAATYAVTFLARELNLFLMPVSVALIGWHALRRRQWPPLWPLLAVTAVPLLAATLVAGLAAGGFGVAWQTLVTTVGQDAVNEYIVRYGGGPWFRYLVDYLLLSPCTTILYLAWLGYLGARAGDEDRVVAWALVPILFLACLAPFSKSLRYVVALETPLRLGAVLFVQRLLTERAGPGWAAAGVALGVAVVAWLDLSTLHGVFVAGQLYDPASANLLAWRRFLP
jgi:4-amino-4-deoxy-L-arabinose transferase-like glycosyltransferase